MALHLTFSNRFESLLEALLAQVGHASADPLAPDRVIIPSVGVRRRIELAAADAHGICANVEFSFLAQWLWQQIATVVDVDEESPFAPSRLAWRMFRILGDPAFTHAHPPLARYLEHADDLMRYDLAVRTASLFDHYITYRPDWLDAWRQQRRIAARPSPEGPFVHEEWQAALWRRVAAEVGTARQHPSVAFFEAIRAGQIDARSAGLPDAAHLFCLPSIPPLYLRMLRELGRWSELHVYVLNPCQEYWFDIVDRRRLAYLEARGKADHHEIANTLLAQWGKQTQAHIDLLLTEWADAAVETTAFVANDADTLLARVQRSILELAEIGPGTLGPVADGDRSIEVHVCHSVTRQLEVLHDQLLAMFAADRSLRPADVLVVTPRLEDAAPMIEAVFGNAPDSRHIPYVVTGRPRSTVNAAARALIDVIAFATSRFAASALVEILQQPVVARRFGLDGAGLASVRRWLREAGIRWGLDAAHRARLDLPPSDRYSFHDGLHRLFLGYALPSNADAPVADRLAAGAPEGSEALALGCVAQVLQQLAALQAELASPRTADEWFGVLARTLATFVEADDDELEDLREVEQALRTLRDEMSAGTEATTVPVEVVRCALQALLDDPARGGVPGGAVTFASMTSLRNLPYRVACAIGMDDGAFPSVDRPLEFDLIAAAPKPGDRQRRTEDRNVFLDLLLAARDRFYVSYTGRHIRDNAVLPPSVLVADLLDALVPAIADDARSAAALEAARSRLVVVHPLQGFSDTYFTPGEDDRLRSYNDEYCNALKARIAAPVEPRAVADRRDADTDAAHDDEPEDAEAPVVEPALAFFAQRELAAPGAEWRVLTVDRLRRFFANPCRYLLTERLGIRLPGSEDELDDTEPFVPALESRSALARRLLPAWLAGRDESAIRAMARAGVEYPPGSFGERLLDSELDALAAFAAQLRVESAAPMLRRRIRRPRVRHRRRDRSPRRELRRPARGRARALSLRRRTRPGLPGRLDRAPVPERARPGRRRGAHAMAFARRLLHPAAGGQRARAAARARGALRLRVAQAAALLPEVSVALRGRGREPFGRARARGRARTAASRARTRTRPTGFVCAASTAPSMTNSSLARRRCSIRCSPTSTIPASDEDPAHRSRRREAEGLRRLRGPARRRQPDRGLRRHRQDVEHLRPVPAPAARARARRRRHPGGHVHQRRHRRAARAHPQAHRAMPRPSARSPARRRPVRGQPDPARRGGAHRRARRRGPPRASARHVRRGVDLHHPRLLPARPR